VKQAGGAKGEVHEGAVVDAPIDAQEL
jgi:hypothetical protein